MADKESRNIHHPVWNVYDSMRTTRLNILYYESKLKTAEKYTLIMQIALAATVPSSAISGFEIWDFGLGKYAWEIIVTISSLIAFIQPFLMLPKKAKLYSELVDGYKILFYDLQDIKHKIEEDNSYADKHKKLFKAAKERKKKLEIKETGVSINQSLKKECQTKVAKELPAENFYIPKEN